ncbi:MAG: GNAT family N-acetyltransferase [Egibacteraceae bacterium]
MTDLAAVDARLVAPADLPRCRDELRAVYRAAFSQEPYFETDGHAPRFAARLASRAEADGFRCATARVPNGELIGFAFGLTSDPLADPPFYSALIDDVGLWVAARWLLGQFELIELAVVPSWQGRGVGGLLHDLTLETVSQPRAWLLVHPLAPARGFYLMRGWLELGHHHTGHRWLVVMGRPLRAPSPRRHTAHATVLRLTHDPWSASP